MSVSGSKRPFYDTIPAQTLIALSFNILSLLAGGLIAVFSPQFQAITWILALFPPILTIRGGIGGIFSGNLATMLHLGLIRPRIRNNTPIFTQLISAIFVITLVDTLLMGSFAFILNILFGKASFSDLFYFVVVPPITCVTAMAISIPLTSLIAITTFQRGLDPDILVYPILASVNDITVTAAFVITVYLGLLGGSFVYVLISIFILMLSITCMFFLRYRKIKFFLQTIKEGTTVVIVSSLFGSINGFFLSSLSRTLLEYPGLVVLYPALTNALGNIGSIIGSTKTTSLALGYTEKIVDEIKNVVSQVAKVEVVAIFMHIVFAMVTYMIIKPTVPEANFSMLISLALVSNLSTFAFIALFALGAAYLAFRKGLNPDNIVIPVITSLSDSVATLSLMPSISFLRLIGIL